MTSKARMNLLPDDFDTKTIDLEPVLKCYPGYPKRVPMRVLIREFGLDRARQLRLAHVKIYRTWAGYQESLKPIEPRCAVRVIGGGVM